MNPNRPSLVSLFLHAFRNYATFNGRAPRAEYWVFVLVQTVAYAMFRILVPINLATGHVPASLPMGEAFLACCAIIYLIAAIIPGIAVMVRRLHDTGRSGWWYLMIFLPLVGSIVLLVFALLPSHEGSNEYGPNPYSPQTGSDIVVSP